jgi:hypothetical protein
VRAAREPTAVDVTPVATTDVEADTPDAVAETAVPEAAVTATMAEEPASPSAANVLDLVSRELR